MTYSLDFRQKVLAIKEQERLTQAKRRAVLGLVSTAYRAGASAWRQSKPAQNLPTKLDMNALEDDVTTYPDAYQHERAARLGVSPRAIGYALKRLGVSYKKNTVASESGRKRTAHLSRQDKSVSGGQ